MKNINVIEDDIEQPEIWCLFCKTTIKSSNSQIACNHIFLHLSYEDHIDSINEFWKEQRPDKFKWKKEQFYLKKADVEEFLKKTEIIFNENKYKEKLIEQNSNNSYIKKSKSFQKINSNEVKNNNHYINNEIKSINIFNNSNSIYNNKNEIKINSNIPYRTVIAYGKNLTCININPNQNIKDNIYNNNSMPIWMLDSSDNESNSEDEELDRKLNIKKKEKDNPIIGPPIDLYLNFKDKEKKNRLNPKRLGSTLNRDKKISKNWMPNFGSIWNAGPRSSTRKEFLNKLKNNSYKLNKYKNNNENNNEYNEHNS